MANMMDYLEWRGDIPLDCQGVNEVDNMIFSMLVYVDLLHIVPSDPNAEGVTLRDAAKEYFFTYDHTQKHPLGLIIPVEVIEMFRRMADLPRYANLTLTGYVNKICERRGMQFSALTIRLPDGSAYVIFRGTDDTLVGWKEDFKLMYLEEVPAQRQAVQYLNSIQVSDGGRLYVSGHSKGGNLAVWAATHADYEVRDKIERVYSNDGPGFPPRMLQSEEYLALRSRFVFLVPQASLVGLLLFNDGGHEVLKSNGKGVFQHNPYTWQVLGGRFTRVRSLDEKALRKETTMRDLIKGMSQDEKRMMVEMFSEILEASGAKTLTELSEGKIKRAFSMLKTFSNMKKEQKDAALYLVGKAFGLNFISEPISSRTLHAKEKEKTEETTPAVAPTKHVDVKTTHKARIQIQFRFQKQRWN